MTIQEKILAGLQQKFPGVDTAILNRISAKKAEGVTDETKADSIAEGVSFSDVLNSYGDYRAGESSRTSVLNYEKKHGLKDGKPLTEEPKEEKGIELEKPKEEETIPAWAKELMASSKSLADELAAMKQERSRETREGQILSKAKEYGIPETWAKRCNIQDGQDLDAYFKEVKQELANAGFEGVRPPLSAEARIEKENESIANMIAEGTKELIKK